MRSRLLLLLVALLLALVLAFVFMTDDTDAPESGPGASRGGAVEVFAGVNAIRA